jgi:hypothetical protein
VCGWVGGGWIGVDKVSGWVSKEEEANVERRPLPSLQ